MLDVGTSEELSENMSPHSNATIRSERLYCAGAAVEETSGFEKIATMKGAELAGRAYEPLFGYFVPKYGATAWRVVTDPYVTDDAGTGVVHQAPAFGEDDYRVCMAAGILVKGAEVPCPVDAAGRFTAEVTDFAGQYVKDADKGIVAEIKAAGRLVDHGSLVHSYPFCWRSETPLIYKARVSFVFSTADK
jgi:isoleucyl-tRNA synthetase